MQYLSPQLSCRNMIRFKIISDCHFHTYFLLCTTYFTLRIQILRQYQNPQLNYNFLKFKMAAVRHVGFSKTWLLTYESPWTVDFSITVLNFVQKCSSTPKLWPKIEIQDGGHPPSWFASSFQTTHEVFSCGHICLSNFMLIRRIVWR